jgi:hypothetical protein
MSTNTYDELQVQIVGTNTPSVTFDSIPQNYTDLILVSHTGYTNTNVGQGLSLRFNGDAGSNYSVTVAESDGSSASAYRGTSQTGGGFCAPSNGNQSFLTPVTTHIFNYTNTTTFKNWLSRNSGPTFVNGYAGVWRATPAAITSISIVATGSSGNIRAGSTFSLYGIRAWAPEVSPKASGGYVSQDSTYWYHAFPFSGAFVPSQSLTADVLVIAGGGGSAHAGGGAGGLCFYASQSLTTTNYAITIGGGGTRGSNPNTGGGQGTNSQFAALTAAVGGGGGAAYASTATTINGGNGGSGGGGSARDTNSTGAGGSPTSGQGFAGGSASFALSPGAVSGGGGGGAGGAGGEASNATSTNGNGGIGSSAYSSWGAATNFGENVAGTYYFAGGGRGNRNFLYGTPGFGAAGMNRGGGANADSAGGSGIVIVRYAK